MVCGLVNEDFCDIIFSSGNLALSRALGDFQFKKNDSLGPEAQIITSNPEVTCHEITEEDEFLVIACDGMSPSTLPTLITAIFRDLGLSDVSTSHRLCAIPGI